MSSHPPAECQQTAPFPNMEANSTVPAKRGPEDDVQFVSAHPVKKFHGSRKPSLSDIQQISVPTTSYPQSPALKGQYSAGYPNTTAAGMPPNEPHHEPCLLNRGVSLSAMEKYVFPPPENTPTNQTSHSSPMLSPKQLPTSMLPNQTNIITEPSPNVSTITPKLSGLPSLREPVIPWGISGLETQPKFLTQNMTLERPMVLVPIQSQCGEPLPAIKGGGQSMIGTDTPKQPDLLLSHISEQHPGGQERPQAEQQLHTAGQMNYSQGLIEGVKSPQPLGHQIENPSQPESYHSAHISSPNAVEIEMEPHSHKIPNSGHNNPGLIPQPPAQKPACLACEQTRQHNVLNQTNGYLAGHPPHMPPHIWHGPGAAGHHHHHHQQLHMAHQMLPPPPAAVAGFSMAPDMHQNFQSRFQPVPISHTPMSYILPPQISSQIPMTTPRPLALATNMTGPEVVHGGHSQNRGQQQTSSGQMSQSPPNIPHRIPHPQYNPSHAPFLQQPNMAPRPMMIHSPATPHTSVPAAQSLLPAGVPPPPPPPPPPASRTSTLTKTAATTKTPPQPREHSPNLIVDIAETCEDLFPWDEVAQRHNVPRQKIVETFSAIIQLPLLRCTTDKRRHGNLATSRLRQYTKAKKDVEAAKVSSSSTTPPPFSTNPSPTPPPTTVTKHHAPMTTTQASNNQDRSIFPIVLEMANTMAPLGLPSSLTNGINQ